MNKIEETIESLEELVDRAKSVPMSSSKIIINRDDIEELISELRMKTPDEIKKYKQLISNRDGILEEARDRAEAMLAEAHAQITELISEHEIMQQAYQQANEIVQQATEHAQEILDRATEDANNIRMGALQYTDDSLATLENIIGRSMDNFAARYEVLFNAMKQSYDVVVANRRELHPEEAPVEEQVAANAEPEVQIPLEEVEATEE